ncbi:MAG: Fe-S cluster assembly ATPase SufC [Candidatus Kerfeldbacteria bacterium]|nr:Fe-S cluster assembly ATPase SufC [Candidatus Kerfeldbacteria bacterium]
MDRLVIRQLYARVTDTPILKGVDLTIQPGTIHALMGPNGSGKSTLASIIAGHPGYTVTRGTMTYGATLLKKLTPDQRAQRGIFLSFQYPVAVPGLSLEHFLRTAYNNIHRGQQLSALEFHKHIEAKMKLLNMKPDFASRALNEGFSGGEKKKSEILQLAVLEPTLAILDETDSGLDIDALRAVAKGINKLVNPKLGILIITHYVRILRYIKPDYVHVMSAGKIIKSGKRTLATQIERRGYDWLLKKKK